ncbi:MAG: undecaprenyl-diphosphate phosphatase [Candidatus Sericytochromatia bacterium]
MGLLEAIVLGIVQGLTEFLPVSSSGHLLMVPWIMGWSEPPFVFDTSLHIGTLVALFIYFKNDIYNLLKGFFKVLKTRDLNSDLDGKLSIYVLIGTIPAGLMGLLFEKKIESTLHSPYILVFTLIIWGILLWLVDRTAKKNKTLNDISLKNALFIGVSQALALIPGTSRSGVTMTAALFSNFNRETAARFSFLLSIPITTAAALYKLKDLFKMEITQNVIINFSCGVLVSGIVGYLCIAYLLKFLRTNSFAVFAIYRIFAGIVLAITLPSLLQTKLELSKVNACNINQSIELKTDNEYIYVKKGDKISLQPVIENISDMDLKDLEISVSTENSLANISKAKIDNVSINSKSKLNDNDFICDKLKENNEILELDISNEAKIGSKIPVNITVKNKVTGKRADFLQKLRVE